MKGYGTDWIQREGVGVDIVSSTNYGVDHEKKAHVNTIVLESCHLQNNPGPRGFLSLRRDDSRVTRDREKRRENQKLFLSLSLSLSLSLLFSLSLSLPPPLSLSHF